MQTYISLLCGRVVRKFPLVDIGVNGKDVTEKDVQRALENGVGHVILTGTCPKSVERACRFAEQHAGGGGVFFTAGVHPHNAKMWNMKTEELLLKYAGHPLCVAIGETGLDFDRMFSPREQQIRVFKKLIEMAIRVGKPLFLHCRDAPGRSDAFNDFRSMLSEHQPLKAGGVVHCFTGTEEELKSHLGMGLDIGITGWICQPRGKELAETLRRMIRRQALSLDRIMLETDAPFLSPVRGCRRNEPANLPYVLEAVAECTGFTPEQVALATTNTAKRLFRLPDDRAAPAAPPPPPPPTPAPTTPAPTTPAPTPPPHMNQNCARRSWAQVARV